MRNNATKHRSRPMRMCIRFVFATFVAAILLALVPATADAQSINAVLHGTVTDSSRAVLPGAKVDVKNLASGELRQATTDVHGFYTITGLAPGHYSVSVSKSGFSTTVRPDVQLQVSQDLEVDSELNLGAVATTVEVKAAATMVDTGSSTLGHVVDSKAAVDLPLNGREFAQLILLSPGAAPVQGSQQTVYMIAFGGGAVSPAVNGQLGNQNVYTIDGILDNHPFIQSFEISPPPDAIQEFKTQNHIVDAEFGFSSGANVNLVTKSGSNEFHGDLWEFHRDTALNAANFFDNYTGSPKRPYLQNQYGFTFGGPVILPFYDGRKQNTHFFGYYEGFRSRQGFTLLTNVPTQAELNGNFADILTQRQATDSNGQPLLDALGRPVIVGQLYNPYSTRTVGGQLVRDPVPGNNITSVMPVNVAASNFLQAIYYPANYGPGGNNFPNRSVSTSQIVTNNQFGIGGDHVFRNNDTVFAKFFYSEPDQDFPNLLKIGTLTNRNHSRLLATSYTHIFSPTLIATLHYGYTNVDFAVNSIPFPQSVIAGINAQNFVRQYQGVPLGPQISIGPRIGSPACPTCLGITQQATPQGPDYMHQFNFDLQKVKGAHTISAGLLYNHVHAYDDGVSSNVGFDQFPTSALVGGSNISSTGDGLASALMNLPSTYSTGFGRTYADIETFWLGGYIQDKWQATRKLNVQVGLRWDFQAPPHYKDNAFAMWNSNCPYGNYTTPQAIQAIEQQCLLVAFPFVVNPTPANPFPASWPKPNTRTSLFQPRYNGWQPRLGLAYKVTPKLVIRTGFSIFDDHNAFDKEMQDPRGSYPAGGIATGTNLNRQVPEAFFDALPSIATLQASSQLAINRAADPKAFIPYVMQWNFGVQQQITENMTLEVDYTGSGSRHLWGNIAYDTPLPANMGPNAIPNGKPFPFFPVLSGDVNIFPANYNALQMSLEKRYSHGLMFLASYTYSKCLNIVGGEFDIRPENTYNLRGSYGPCNANIPHIFSFSPVYELPFGRGARLAAGAGRLLDALIGGWSISDITSIHSGLALNPTLASDIANAGTSSGQRGNFVLGCNLTPPGFIQNAEHWYNPACIVNPPQYTFGTISRNAYRGPHFVDFDIAVLKTFRIAERSALQVRVESFNAFNHTNFQNPQSTIGTTSFMKITGAYDPREIQFGAKITF